MKKRILALLITVAILGGLFAACRGDVPPAPTLNETSPPPQVEEPSIPPLDEPEPDPAPESDLPNETREAILSFSQALFHGVLDSDDPNPVLSPLSAYYALAMTALGADGETAAEFQDVLGRDPAALTEDLRALTALLTAASGNTALNIAGGVWTDERFAIHPEFAALLEEYFDAPAESLDFDDPETVRVINAWVYEQTHGLIEEFLSSIGQEEMMLLINTLYFRGQWAAAFHPMTSFDGFFYPADRSEVEAEFLSTHSVPLFVSVTDNYEAVSLPYDDDRLAFLLVRPIDGSDVRDFAARFDLAETLASLETHDSVQVRMPKLDLTFESELNMLLEQMGLRSAFCDSAEFPDLTTGDEALLITSVFQKVRLLVDEEGTEAAAATGVMIGATSIDLDQLNLNFDTPYLYVIYDIELGIPLFMGILENPAL